ncbi:MAG: hypothetical protein HN951_01395, partial [Flavobacteriales bacterium]|nr:hypothetical protein [Flavobacteriales bacterium]
MKKHIVLILVIFAVNSIITAQEVNAEDMRDLYDGFHTVYWQNGSKYFGDIYGGEMGGSGTMIWSD